MPRVDVDTHLWDTDEAFELGALLDDPDAWRFAVRLWAWGIDTDRKDGMLRHVPPATMAAKAGYPGDPALFLSSMVRVRYLEEREPGCYYMRGWSRTKRYFRERERLRANAEARRAKRDAERDVHASDTRAGRVQDAECTQNARGNRSPSRSPSRSRSLEEEAQAPETTAPSGPVSTVEQLTERVAALGWAVVLSPSQVVAATALLDERPIAVQELVWAEDRVKARGGRPNVGLLLSVIQGERSKPKPVPGSEHERASRQERAPPRRVARPPAREAETPFATPIGEGVREILSKLRGAHG